MNRGVIILISSFLLYLLLQVIFVRGLVLFNTAFCFVYVAFLLLLPVETSRMVLILIGFGLGFSIDIFYDSLGTHAAASVFIMFIRNSWLNVLTPQGGYDPGSRPSIYLNGFNWFLVYIIPLLLIHHGILFFVEAGGFGLFGFTLLKILGSVILSALVIVLVQYLFPVRSRI